MLVLVGRCLPKMVKYLLFLLPFLTFPPVKLENVLELVNLGQTS